VLTLAVSIVVVITLRHVLLIADRGSREHLIWARAPRQYLDYLASLDRRGSVVRDVANVINNRGMRRTLGLRAYGHFALIVAVVAAGGLFEWWPPVVAGVCAVLWNLPQLMNRLVVRARGHIDYAEKYNAAQKSLAITAAVVTIILSWIIFRTYLALCFGPPWPVDNVWTQWTVIAGCVLLVAGTNTVAQRVIASLAPPNFAQTTDASSTLLLRSFSDDRLRMRHPMHADPLLNMLGTRATFEKCIADFLIGDGNLVAIGKPGERLPRLGALRTYWPDDQWQDAVRTTASRAQAIFLIAGSTQGLSWEVRQLKDLGLLPKTLFFIPPLPEAATERRLEQLLNDLDAPETTFAQARECITNTVTAVRVTSDGNIVLHLSDGRDWSSYLGTSTYFIGELSGRVRPPAVGELAKHYYGEAP
jgi:hypothetical protein